MNQTIMTQPAPAAQRPSIAYLLGASDAEGNAGCVPEMFFLNRDSIRQYVTGYLSVNWSPMAVMVARYYGVEVTA